MCLVGVSNRFQMDLSTRLILPETVKSTVTGPQPVDIFGGGRQNDCNLLLGLTTKHVLENFEGRTIARLPTPCFLACLGIMH